MRVAPAASWRTALLATVLAGFATVPAATAQDAPLPERTIAALPKSCWFLVPPKKPPKAGAKAGLIVVLPGGTGTKDFLPFVQNGLLAQAPDDFAGAMLTAVKWRDDQQFVWPTAATKVDGLQYTTEQYVRAVVAEVEKELAIDPARRVVVAWSSSGPAIHPLLATADSPFARAYIAMSVWPALDDLAAVKGRRYVLDQSPDDQTTIFQHVRTAHAALTKAGAQVRVSVYAGEHGWGEQPLPRFAKNLEWLLSEQPAGKPEWPPGKLAKKGGKPVNQLANGGFEDGTKGWNTIDNSRRLKVDPDSTERAEGKQSLHLGKTGGAPLDLVVQSTELAPGKRVAASLRWRAKGVENAFVKVWLYGDGEQALHEDAMLLKVPADGAKWQLAKREWDTKGATRATVQIVMLGAGELWIDDVVLTVDG
jgi:predicted esterase